MNHCRPKKPLSLNFYVLEIATKIVIREKKMTDIFHSIFFLPCLTLPYLYSFFFVSLSSVGVVEGKGETDQLLGKSIVKRRGCFSFKNECARLNRCAPFSGNDARPTSGIETV